MFELTEMLEVSSSFVIEFLYKFGQHVKIAVKSLLILECFFQVTNVVFLW